VMGFLDGSKCRLCHLTIAHCHILIAQTACLWCTFDISDNVCVRIDSNYQIDTLTQVHMYMDYCTESLMVYL
jgi:hypothetical protein